MPNQKLYKNVELEKISSVDHEVANKSYHINMYIRL